LKEAHVVANLDGLVAGGAEGEGAGDFGDNLDEAFFPVLLREDVFLRGGDEAETLGGRSRCPLGGRTFADELATASSVIFSSVSSIQVS
jgi:hypothetical protein